MEVVIMKKLYMMLLTMVLVVMSLATPLYATQGGTSATAFSTQDSKDKIYFRMKGSWDSDLKLPIKYNQGTLGGANFYDMGHVILGEGYNEKYELTFNQNTVTAKIVDNEETGRKHLVVAPKKKGATTLTVKVSHPEFNTVTLNTKVTVTDKVLDWTSTPIVDKYRQEYNSVKTGILIENTKLFIFELNKERSAIKLSDVYKDSKYGMKVAEETIKLLTGGKSTPTSMHILKSGHKAMDNLAKLRVQELSIANEHDDHEGLYTILETRVYDDYNMGETLLQSKNFRHPEGLVKGYKSSPLHWAQLTSNRYNHIVAYTFKSNNGTLLNVSIPFADYIVEGVDVIGAIVDLSSKWANLMTEEEKEYYGDYSIFDEH